MSDHDSDLEQEPVSAEEEVVEEPHESVEEPAVEEPQEEVAAVEEPQEEVAVEEPQEEVAAAEEPQEEVVAAEESEETVEEPQETVEEPAAQEESEEPSQESVVSQEEPATQEKPEVEVAPEESTQEEPVVAVPELKEPEVEAVDAVSTTDSISFSIEEPILSFIPKLVFIVPYRDREQQQLFFANHMATILEDYPVGDYQIFYIHQSDKRSFNRGAMKNIGFLHVKALYPNDYKNITLVFNDVDTMPLTKGFFNYETTVGVVKHFYGYKFTLGGIVSINAGDFEKIDGFPNYWAWGYEDNSLQNRIVAANLTIDRSQFYPILDKNVMQLKDGVERMVNRQEYDRYIEEAKYKVVNDGISKIANLAYIVDKTKGFVHVSQFTTAVAEKSELNQQYDLRNGPVPFKLNTSQRRGRAVMRMGGGF
jgi:hypothetical protein